MLLKTTEFLEAGLSSSKSKTSTAHHSGTLHNLRVLLVVYTTSSIDDNSIFIERGVLADHILSDASWTQAYYICLLNLLCYPLDIKLVVLHLRHEIIHQYAVSQSLQRLRTPFMVMTLESRWPKKQCQRPSCISLLESG